MKTICARAMVTLALTIAIVCMLGIPYARANDPVRFECGDKLVDYYVNSGRYVDVKTKRRLPSRLFEWGPRGGLYLRKGSKCFGEW